MPLSLLWKDSTIGSELGVMSTPALEDGRAYLANRAGTVYCIELSDGETIWHTDTKSKIYADIITIRDFVIVSCADRSVYALDKSDGTVVWNCLTSGPISNAPAEQDGLLYVGTQVSDRDTQDCDLCCIDSRDGSVRWTYSVPEPIVMSPALSGHYLVFGCDDYYIYCVNTLSRELIWRQQTPYFVRSSPVITKIESESAEKVFIGSWCDMWCMDLATGHLDWSFPTEGEIMNRPCVHRQGVIFGNEAGKVYSLDKRTGELQWTASTKNIVYATPVIIASHVLVASQDNYLYCFDIHRGECKWRQGFKPCVSRFSFADRYLLLASYGRDIYCFGITGQR